jgi:Na+-driven multidrug efflux pump
VWLTGFANMAFMAVVGASYIVFDHELIHIFTGLPGVVAAGAECLRTVSYGYLFYAWEIVMTQAFNGAGDTMTPTRINFFCFWLLEIPLAYLLALRLGVGEAGVYWSIVIAESVAGVVAIFMFRRGRWKERVV